MSNHTIVLLWMEMDGRGENSRTERQIILQFSSTTHLKLNSSLSGLFWNEIILCLQSQAILFFFLIVWYYAKHPSLLECKSIKTRNMGFWIVWLMKTWLTWTLFHQFQQIIKTKGDTSLVFGNWKVRSFSPLIWFIALWILQQLYHSSSHKYHVIVLSFCFVFE